MITLSAWLYLWGSLVHHVCVLGLPADSDVQGGSSDDDVQVYFDIDSDTRRTENKLLGYFQDLMNNPKLTQQESSGLIPVPPGSVGKWPANEKGDYGSKGKPREDVNSGIKTQGGSPPSPGRTRQAEMDTSRKILDNKVPIPTRRKDQSKEESETLTRQELVTLFSRSFKGTATMIGGCSLLHFSVRSRCVANVLELTATSPSPVLAQLLLVEGDGQVLMDGAYLVLYAIQGPATPGRPWRLSRELLKSDINLDCTTCDNLLVRLLIKVGDTTCGIEVTCQQTGGSRLGNRVVVEKGSSPSSTPIIVTSPKPVSAAPPQDPTSSAKTTISLVYGLGVNGADVSGPVALGTLMSLVVSVYCQDATIDLHMVKCDAKGEDGSTLPLVKDGCSASQVIGEFREVLGLVHEASLGPKPVRRVSQYARLEAFNTRSTSQMITILCTIKICSGECAEQPPCVSSDVNLGRSKRPTVSLYSQEVTLGKALTIEGLPSGDVLRSEGVGGVPALNCVSLHTLFAVVGILTGVYLSVLVACVYCVRHSTKRTFVRNHMEDFESPSRALYQEYTSPRRRTTPKSSPEYSTFAMSADERRS